MPNLFDYLSWRGDVPFRLDPFNEVDNLVLSQLAYTDFAGCVPGDGSSVSIQQARDAFFARHTREEVEADRSFVGRAPLLLEDMAAGARFRGLRLARYIDEIDPDRDQQISAVTYLMEDGTAYVAFRGTDDTVTGWKEDFNISYLAGTPGQRRAAEYLSHAALERPQVRVGGHSKGGNFAVYAASFCGPEAQDHLTEIYTNDGPGFPEEITREAGYQRIQSRVISIVPESSVIGMLLTGMRERRVVASDAVGILQHDAFSWQIRRNRFVDSELTEAALFVQQTMAEWLSGMDDDARKAFTDTLFSIFEATGRETFSDIGGSWWKSAEAMLSTINGLPRERREQMRAFFQKLLESGTHTAAAQIAARPALRRLETGLKPRGEKAEPTPQE